MYRFVNPAVYFVGESHLQQPSNQPDLAQDLAHLKVADSAHELVEHLVEAEPVSEYWRGLSSEARRESSVGDTAFLLALLRLGLHASHQVEDSQGQFGKICPACEGAHEDSIEQLDGFAVVLVAMALGTA